MHATMISQIVPKLRLSARSRSRALSNMARARVGNNHDALGPHPAVCCTHPSRREIMTWASSSRSREPPKCIRPTTIPQTNYEASLHTTTNTLATITNNSMSDGISRGTDLLADSLAHGSRRKIVLESYGPSGVDVKGFVQVGDAPEEEDLTGQDKIIHMNGSIVAFSDSCFLWNVTAPEKVTLESLSVIHLYHPVVEYLFIGCDKPLPPRELNKIKKEFRKKDIVVEQMDVMNTMGTFNILNGEDRRVACVLVIDPTDES